METKLLRKSKSIHAIYKFEFICVKSCAKPMPLITCSAVFKRFSISKLLVRLVCLTPTGRFCGSIDDGAGELSTSGENTSLPIGNTINNVERTILGYFFSPHNNNDNLII